MKIIIVFLTTLSFLIFFPTLISANEGNQFITIVNPVRISSYAKDPKASLASQYSEIKNRNLSATWLLAYDAIMDEGVISLIRSMDEKQEIGIFMEVTPKIAKDAGVTYTKTDSWHRANAVFLSGYSQENRLKLIDIVFNKFKETFGFYPKSIGAWWIDSFSLSYMKNKYGITANLDCADQFATDGYQIWGQFWSVPFYPSKNHSGSPARAIENKVGVVTTQWAARDPLNGYGTGRESAYSTQDYFTINLNDDYFKKLVELYAGRHNNEFGQITVGLEGDFTPDTYSGTFARQMEIIKQFEESGKFKVVTMGEFSKWYIQTFPGLSPPHVITTDDLLGKGGKVVWYQSPAYRLGLSYDLQKRKTKIFDFRTYHDDFQEPYYFSPNRELNLFINLPSLIDQANNPQDFWAIPKRMISTTGDAKNFVINFEDNEKIVFTEGQFEIDMTGGILPPAIKNSKILDIKENKNSTVIIPKQGWIIPEGYVFKDLSLEATYFLKQKKIVIFIISIVLLIALTNFFVFKTKKKKIIKIISFMLSFLIPLVISGTWIFQNSKQYFVSQSEMDALSRLSLLPPGRVIVYDKNCLQCSWHGRFLPAAFGNKRNYVQKFSKKPMVKNITIFNAKTREDGRKELLKLDAKYIYLVKLEDYIETTPFSPGDLNIEKIYANANAEIWKIHSK